MKKAFSMIELIFVIVIVGILSSIAIAKVHNSNELITSAQDFIKDIKYAQYLALNNDVSTSSTQENYDENYWTMSVNNQGYVITKNQGKDVAIDYLTNKKMCNPAIDKQCTEDDRNFLENKNIEITPQLNIVFTEFGKPKILGNNQNFPLKFQFKHKNNTICVVIEDTTGYAWINNDCK